MSTIGNIITAEFLNKDVLNKTIIDSLLENGVKYISNESLECLRLYKDSEDLRVAQDLWKNLLIDSICILKINDSREKIYADCKKLGFTSANFKNIRKTSSYGIDEIEQYFNDFVEFEGALYGTNKHYRDHVDHVLQVWLMGWSLIQHNEFVLSDGYILNKEEIFHFNINEYDSNISGKQILNKQKLKIKNRTITVSEFWAMWTMAALCHDLGYPIEKTSNINRQAKKIIKHFGNMNFSELNYNFDIFNTFLVDKFLNVISSRADFSNNDNYTILQTKFRDKFSKTLEDCKHGIFSSLLIYKNLTYFLETDYFVSKSNLDSEDLRQFYIRKEILRSIASHTCPKIYHINLNTLSFLLILCDELQEWNRPNFEELRSKLEGETPKISLKEFDMNLNQKVHIVFDYSEFIKKISGDNKTYIIENKFKTINCLLRTAKEDYNRKIDFKWEIFFADEKFFFVFDSHQNSFEILKVLHSKLNSETSDFPEPEPYILYK